MIYFKIFFADVKWSKNPIAASVHPHSLGMDSGADVIVQLQVHVVAMPGN